MPRVIGIDPGTLSIDVCGLADSRVFLDRSLPTAETLANPSDLIALLDAANREAPLDLIAGPSGYGLPLIRARDVSERDIRLAQLTAQGEQSGGIGGLGTLMRRLAGSTLPIVFTPGVIHLESVPEHRKINRVDMGTADKVCATVLALHEQQERAMSGGSARSSFILLELGGAFTAAIAVHDGEIVDGMGGTSGPLGWRGAGALDGEVAFLASSVPKSLLFSGGASTIAGDPASPPDMAGSSTPRGRLAWTAYFEGAVKAIAALAVSVPRPDEVILSGRLARLAGVPEELRERLAPVVPTAIVRALEGFARTAKHAAQGAALLADGLAGGRSAAMIGTMGIRRARGTVLDHLYVISSAAARARLGIAE